MCKLSEISLSSLKENDVIGILCKSCDRTLHFYIGSTHLEIKLPDGDMRLPSSRYAVVDMYGRCCAIEFRGLEDVSGRDDSDGVIRIQIDKDQLTHVKRHLKNSKKSKTKHQEQQQQQPVGEVTVKEHVPPLFVVGDGDVQQQIEPEEIENGYVENREGVKWSVPSLTPHSPAAKKQRCDGACSCLDCPYYRSCKEYLQRLSVPGRICVAAACICIQILSTKNKYLSLGAVPGWG